MGYTICSVKATKKSEIGRLNRERRSKPARETIAFEVVVVVVAVSGARIGC